MGVATLLEQAIKDAGEVESWLLRLQALFKIYKTRLPTNSHFWRFHDCWNPQYKIQKRNTLPWSLKAGRRKNPEDGGQQNQMTDDKKPGDIQRMAQDRMENSYFGLPNGGDCNGQQTTDNWHFRAMGFALPITLLCLPGY